MRTGSPTARCPSWPRSPRSTCRAPATSANSAARACTVSTITCAAACGDFNFAKRSQTADLRGRVALISGARVKIGYQAAIMLLRAGARVIVTTRFPRDAALRYARESDFEDFRDRLKIYGLDLRHTPSVEAFAEVIVRSEPRLDFILHNACQTVRRPVGFLSTLDGWRARAARSIAGSRRAARPGLRGHARGGSSRARRRNALGALRPSA